MSDFGLTAQQQPIADAPHWEPIAEVPLRGPIAEVTLLQEAHRLFPTVFHMLITGCTARPKRAGSRGLSRDGSCASSWYWITCCLVMGIFPRSRGVLGIWVTWGFTGSRTGPVVRVTRGLGEQYVEVLSGMVFRAGL